MSIRGPRGEGVASAGLLRRARLRNRGGARDPCGWRSGWDGEFGLPFRSGGIALAVGTTRPRARGLWNEGIQVVQLGSGLSRFSAPYLRLEGARSIRYQGVTQFAWGAMPRTENAAALLGRVAMSLLFIHGGWGKLLAPAATQAMLASHHLPMVKFGWILAVVVELGGGFAILLGLFTRPVGLVLAV